MDEIGAAHDPFPLSRAGHFVGQPGQAALININAPNLGDGVLVHSRSSEVRLIIEPRKFDVKVAIRPLFSLLVMSLVITQSTWAQRVI
jgi:hypothetical protein